MAGYVLHTRLSKIFFNAFRIAMTTAYYSSTGSKSSFPTPHSGHTQSSGRSSKATPGAMPPSGSQQQDHKSNRILCIHTFSYSFYFYVNNINLNGHTPKKIISNGYFYLKK